MKIRVTYSNAIYRKEEIKTHCPDPIVQAFEQKILDIAADEGITVFEAGHVFLEQQPETEPEFVGDMARKCPDLMSAVKTEATTLKLLKR